MISRQGSQRNMLRTEAVFDISFKQLGQSGFMTALEIYCCNILRLSERFQRTAQKMHGQKNTNRPASGERYLTAIL
jgi:hypothetical protein